jgi:Domain of unknown function (DUF4760)
MNKSESADLILKLYDLRREEKMRAARDWFPTFFPNSAQEIMGAMVNAETSAKLRMVISYWDMAATLVNHGAIDEAMFNESAGEHIMVFSKVEPYIAELREMFGNPTFLANLEKLIMRMPNAKEMLESRREMMAKWVQARAEAANVG